MKRILCMIVLLLWLGGQAAALPQELAQSGDAALAQLVEQPQLSLPEKLQQGVLLLWQKLSGQVGSIFRTSLRSVLRLLLAVLLCGLLEGFLTPLQGGKSFLVQTAGTLLIAGLTLGEMDRFLALGLETVQEISSFSKLLLPTVTAAAVAAGQVSAATARQVGTVFFLDLLLTGAEHFLLPLLRCYLAALTLGSLLQGGSLKALAEGIRKAVKWLLTGIIMVFFAYMSLTSGISGSADAMAVKATKLVMGGMLPVVGSVIADASETVLKGAQLLRNSVGLFGMLSTVSLCLFPFLRLGIQYLLYKCAAFAALTAGDSPQVRLIEGYAGAFGLLLGMTGTCALLLFISMVFAVSAVTV